MKTKEYINTVLAFEAQGIIHVSVFYAMFYFTGWLPVPSGQFMFLVLILVSMDARNSVREIEIKQAIKDKC